MATGQDTHWEVLGDGKRKYHFLCRCVCGEVREVTKNGVRSGRSKSCGCRGVVFVTHGATRGRKRTPEYTAWRSMISRCYMPSSTGYSWYGARGIRVCDRWRGKDGFTCFLADMGPRPGRGYSVDRVNVNGDYEPGNVRWATWVEQAGNRRNSLLLTHEGRTMPLTEWAEEVGILPATIWSRLTYLKWPVSKALTKAVRRGGRKSRLRCG